MKAKGILGGLGAGLAALTVHDLLQTKHSILRNYPVIGRARFMLEGIRPEIQQYFIERNWDGRPYDRVTRSLIYARAKGEKAEHAFGTERDVLSSGAEYLAHSTLPSHEITEIPRVMVGGRDCLKPYSMSLMNVSAMSFGSLSSHAIMALNKGAAMGGFAHDTGEGSLTEYHEKFGGDLIWEIGTGYFGCRTEDGNFDPEMFARKAQKDQVKMVSLKLSQGAKPGIGGVLPGEKVTEEIARIREVPVGKTVISPARHRVFDTPEGLIRFIGQLRDLSGGKPVGFKMCVSSRVEVLAICKAMMALDSYPDFIIVDGSEGGTGAAPPEFEDHVGMPLAEGLMIWHNALVGTGLREHIKLGASGKVAAGNDIIKAIIQGADFTLSARAMMMAVGCIQAQACHTGKCPTGVATQDKRRERALVVEDKGDRVKNYQEGTLREVLLMLGAMGVEHPDELKPWMLRRMIAPGLSRSYQELYHWLTPGELIEGNTTHESWSRDWRLASSTSFRHDGHRA